MLLEIPKAIVSLVGFKFTLKSSQIRFDALYLPSLSPFKQGCTCASPALETWTPTASKVPRLIQKFKFTFEPCCGAPFCLFLLGACLELTLVYCVVSKFEKT